MRRDPTLSCVRGVEFSMPNTKPLAVETVHLKHKQHPHYLRQFIHQFNAYQYVYPEMKAERH
jgi:hypothetical protein